MSTVFDINVDNMTQFNQFKFLIKRMVPAVAFWLAAIAPGTADADTGGPSQPGPITGQNATALRYVGQPVCGRCHQEQQQRWTGSDHDYAMQVANEQTVLGDFDHARFTYYGLTSTFFKRDGKFMVRTDGPAGELHDYEIKYTFGIHPLQQYLIEFPDGRLQALGIAWDSRPREQGGQRWFHLYPTEKISFTDSLHWTGLDQNWNYMCAECHSTNLQKNYDPATNRFNTTWSEIDVACEACHGPGSRHVTWAEHQPGWEALDNDPAKGLVVRFKERDGVQWRMDANTGNARRTPPRQTDIEIETCARCHSRRGWFWADYLPGRPILDTHLVQLLTPGLYHADGQMQDEVYNYGSFLQSKMAHAGVTCSDCHDPHSLKLRVPGNQMCAQCHNPGKYDTTAHHFHKADSTGAGCAACHMPTTTYMGVDPRHDHSFRIPRPDLSVQLGTPNACNNCHTDHPAGWALDRIEHWYRKPLKGYQQFAEALHAGRTGAPGAEQALTQLAGDTGQPAIARATALAALNRYLSPASLGVVRQGLQDDDPLLRLGAVQALDGIDPQMRLPLLFPLLQDPIRALRIEAARRLAPLPSAILAQLPPAHRAVLDKATAEYITAQQTNADRPESHLNLGSLYTERGEFTQAETAYRTALRLQPTFVQAYVNLADLYRLQGKDDDGEKALRQAAAIAPQDADVQQALGLLLVRRHRLPEAVEALAQATRLNPDNMHYRYVYAVALHSTGKPDEAIEVLEEAHARRPNDRELLYALTTFQRDRGDLEAARRYAQQLLTLTPQDPVVRRLVDQLQAR
ncbi:MAG: tetratricopeptide repeat protein [Candidatus Competibacteraceae bacterium]